MGSARPERPAEKVEPPTSDYAPHPPSEAALSTPLTARQSTRSKTVVHPPLAPEPPPERVGRYAIRRKLGQGGFGTVYLAWDEVLCREVALKLPHPHVVAAPGREIFLAEARMAAKLRHPGIVIVHDVGWDDDAGGYVVYEFVPGRTLRDRITADPWQPAAAAQLALALAQALHAAHQQGLVHRDLKPGNILLDASDRPRIADFGMAVDEQSQRTLRGEVAGTWTYMSPEQIRGETHRLDGRTDLWSLGIILYELLAGRRPFGGRQHEVTEEILQREPRPLRQLNERVSRRLEAICLRCLAKPVTERYASALDLIEDLEALIRDGDSSRTTRDASTQPMPPPEGYARGDSVDSVTPGSGSQSTIAASAPWMIGGPVIFLLAVAGSVTVAWLAGAFSGPPEQKVLAGNPEPHAGIAANGPPTADVWIGLLNQKPRPLVWVEHDSGSRWSSDARELWAQSSFPALFELCQTDEPNYQFRVTLQQTPWVGRIGVFLGHQETLGDPAVVQYELLSLEPLDPRDNAKFSIQRTLVTQERGGFQRIREMRQLGKVDIRQPALDPLMLTGEVRQGKLASVHFGGQPLPTLATVPAALVPLTRPLTGRLGLYLSQSSGVFRQPMFRFTRENAP